MRLREDPPRTRLYTLLLEPLSALESPQMMYQAALATQHLDTTGRRHLRL